MSISIEEMLAAGVHFGHQTCYWHPKMAPYIFGVRNKIHIINLDKTLTAFNKALWYVRDLARKKGKILFVGTKRAAQKAIREEAVRCGMPYVDYRWLGGMLTNYKTLRHSIKRLKELETAFIKGTYANYAKKEIIALTRQKQKLEQSLGGIKNMGGLPDALFIIDVRSEAIALKEAIKLGIPVIAIIDTNNVMDGVNYPIPGNDDSSGAIRLYSREIANSIIEGKVFKAEAENFSGFDVAKSSEVQPAEDESVSPLVS